jgi:hypothetical protein
MNGEWGSFTNTDRSEEKKNKSQKNQRDARPRGAQV